MTKNNETEIKKYSEEELIELYRNKKIFIFDLDDTLILNKNNNNSYNIKITNFIKKLKNAGKIIGIATYNLDPVLALKIRNKELLCLLDHKHIIKPVKYPVKLREYINKYGKPNFNTYDHLYYHKSYMIKELLSIINNIHNDDLTLNDIIFFDDQIQNINDCVNNGITSVLVDPEIGIISL